MADIEKHNPELAGVLPRNYQIFNGTLLKELLKTISEIPVSLDFDAFGRIYEYFLGEFARTEGQKGGEFYTPAPIVRLMVEILEPFHGRILDPACGSGGMFVQSARFVAEHKKSPSSELSIFGDEREEVKKVARRLLTKLHELLVLGWRQKIQARAKVRLAIEDTLDEGLPRAYTKELFSKKTEVLFEHVYEA